MFYSTVMGEVGPILTTLSAEHFQISLKTNLILVMEVEIYHSELRMGSEQHSCNIHGCESASYNLQS